MIKTKQLALTFFHESKSGGDLPQQTPVPFTALEGQVALVIWSVCAIATDTAPEDISMIIQLDAVIQVQSFFEAGKSVGSSGTVQAYLGPLTAGPHTVNGELIDATGNGAQQILSQMTVILF